jgi:hypothetical protein
MLWRSYHRVISPSYHPVWPAAPRCYASYEEHSTCMMYSYLRYKLKALICPRAQGHQLCFFVRKKKGLTPGLLRTPSGYSTRCVSESSTITDTYDLCSVTVLT